MQRFLPLAFCLLLTCPLAHSQNEQDPAPPYGGGHPADFDLLTYQDLQAIASLATNKAALCLQSYNEAFAAVNGPAGYKALIDGTADEWNSWDWEFFAPGQPGNGLFGELDGAGDTVDFWNEMLVGPPIEGSCNQLRIDGDADLVEAHEAMEDTTGDDDVLIEETYQLYEWVLDDHYYPSIAGSSFVTTAVGIETTNWQNTADQAYMSYLMWSYGY